jgi:hypothetical protein
MPGRDVQKTRGRRAKKPIDERACLKGRTWLLNAINDIIEMQRAKATVADTVNGALGFAATLYGARHEHWFSV